MNPWILSEYAEFLVTLPFVLVVAYLVVLTGAAILHSERKQISGVYRRERVAKNRFMIVIPAHNEELLLGDVIRKLDILTYPKSHYEVVVIADNCSDNTASIAREAGATTLERTDLEKRGKGQALDWAFQEHLTHWLRPWDAVIVMDADSTLTPDFLWFMNEGLTEGHQVMQGYYGVENPGDSWRTALMFVALAALHFVRPLGRDKLGLPCGLKGNGMCFSRSVVERFGYPATSVVEDAELALILLSEGIGVKFVPGAQVFGQMAKSSDQADSQRQRWEGARIAIIKEWAFPTLRDGLRERNLLKIDGAIDLFIPPFALVVMPAIVLSTIGLALHALHADWESDVVLTDWSMILIGIFFYVVVGLILTRAPMGVWLRLTAVPLFILWKLLLYVKLAAKGKASPSSWVRTKRHGMKETDSSR